MRIRITNWNEREIRILKENYYNLNKEELLKLLPNRTWWAIQRQAYLLKIKRLSFKNYKLKEIDYIKDNYQFKNNKELSHILNKSDSSISLKLGQLGLKRNIITKKTLNQPLRKYQSGCRSYHYLTAIEKDVILTFNENQNMKKTGKLFHIGEFTIKDILLKNNIEISKRNQWRLGTSKLLNKKEEIIYLYNNGMSALQVAKQFGVYHATITRLLQDWGIELKTKSEIAKKNWQNPEFATKIIKSFNLKPNKSEQILINLLQRYFPNEWKYVGNGDFWIKGRNPDFINVNGKKIVIELFGEYWHSKELNPKVTSQRTIKNTIEHYNQYGFNTLILWTEELKHPEQVLQRISDLYEK